MTAETAKAEPLALRPKDAAAMLGVSERTLWSLTKSGDIPTARVGRAVLVPVEGLKAFLAAKVREAQQ